MEVAAPRRIEQVFCSETDRTPRQDNCVDGAVLWRDRICQERVIWTYVTHRNHITTNTTEKRKLHALHSNDTTLLITGN